MILSLQKGKRKRIRMMSDDEESGREEEKMQDDREAIAREIFEGDDDDEGMSVADRGERDHESLMETDNQRPEGGEFGDLSGSEEEGESHKFRS
jgi:hypothetical protein